MIEAKENKYLAYVRYFHLSKIDKPSYDRNHVDIITDAPNNEYSCIYDFCRTDGNFMKSLPDYIDVDDVIMRCRLLRAFRKEKAVSLIKSVYFGLTENINFSSYKAFICLVVDNYILHIMSKICKANGVPFIAFCPSYFEGYSYLVDVDRPAIRRPHIEGREINFVKSKYLKDKFRRDYNQISRYDFALHSFLFARHVAKRLIFGFKALKGYGDLDYHHVVTPFIAERKNIFNYPRGKEFSHDIPELAFDEKPVIYLPLSFTPECSTDYWIPDLSFIDYEKKVIEIARELSKEFVVVVKDHFHMLGIRKLEFYRELADINMVTVLSPYINNNDVVNHSDVVLVGAGSAGFEAIVRNRKVATYSDTIYWNKSQLALNLSSKPLGQWNGLLMDFIRNDESLAGYDLDSYIEECLRYHFPGDLLTLKDVNLSDVLDVLET